MTPAKKAAHMLAPVLEEGREWPAETAGHRMTRKVPTVYTDQNVGDIQNFILHCIHVFRSIDYVYVLHRDGTFAGVMSVKDLYGAEKTINVESVCKTSSLITVHPKAHQERVVYLALKNNIKAVPVVDDDDKFLGAVLNDTILTILYKEAHEDLLHMAGITHPHAIHTNVLEASLFTSFRHRAPWLFIGLLGGLLSATIIKFFESTLEQNLLLASFIPLVVYMSSAVGMQMETCFIRDLAIEHKLPFLRYFTRQIAITLCISFFFSLAFMAMLYIFHGDSTLGFIGGISLAIAIISSVFTGLLIPFAFSRMRLDPADVSGPIATIVQDLLSVTIYFSVATWLL